MANKRRRKKKKNFFERRNKIKQIILEGADVPPLEVERTTEVQFQSRNKKEFIYFEKNGDDGQWTITYTANTLPDPESLEAIILLRESDLREEGI